MNPRHVYLFLVAGEHKIGVSGDPQARLAQVASERCAEGVILHAFPCADPFKTEGVLHRHFASKLIKGEWFLLDADDVAWFRSILSETDLPKQEKLPSPTSTARFPVELLRQARVVASYRGIDLGDYLVSLLSAPVERDYGRIVKADAE